MATATQQDTQSEKVNQTAADSENVNEEQFNEEFEKGFDSEEEYQEDGSFEEEDEPKSTADHMRDYADQDLIDETVEAISSMYRKNVDNGKIEIGELLLDKVFEGKVEQAMSTNPQKNETFAKIAARLDRLVEPKTLGSWVRAAAAMRDLKKRGINVPNLTTYHYVELATVRDEKERIKFAKDAEVKGWSVKALREEIRKANGKSKSDTEKLKDEMDRSLRQFTDLSADQDLTEFASDLESVKKTYPPEKAMKLLPDVKKCLANVRAQEKLFKELHGSLRAIVKEAMEPLSD